MFTDLLRIIPQNWPATRRLALAAIASLLAARSPSYAEETKPLIQIGVEVVEVNEKKSQKLGIQWIGDLHIEEVAVPSLLKVGTFARSKVFADIQALLTEGGADLLANPKLVTRDNTIATFHAGGELPYAVSSGLGTANVEFKSYGVNLKINPRLEPNGNIAMMIDAEVSGPDEQNSVTLAGNIVPGLRSRRVSSQLTLQPGSTLTMAGLIQNQKQWTRRGVPGLMHIPLLGRLFSHKVQDNQRTSIVVFVTPTVLEPASAAIVPFQPLMPPALAAPTNGEAMSRSTPPWEKEDLLDDPRI
jgi:type II secretory pathway component GspD/PulD (secretin)